jgi:hypothetical protein
MVGGESMARVCGGESLTDQTPTIQSNPIQSNPIQPFQPFQPSRKRSEGDDARVPCKWNPSSDRHYLMENENLIQDQQT